MSGDYTCQRHVEIQRFENHLRLYYNLIIFRGRLTKILSQEITSHSKHAL
jgi:hypothetical protein